MNKYEIRIRFTRMLCIAVYALLLAACNKTPEPLPVDEPVCYRKYYSFSSHSLTARRLLTRRWWTAQENVLSLPARIVWDEITPAALCPPVAGRLDEIMCSRVRRLSRPDAGVFEFSGAGMRPNRIDACAG